MQKAHGFKNFELDPSQVDSVISAVTDFSLGNTKFSGLGLDKVQEYAWPKKGPSLDDLVCKLDPTIELSGKNNYEKNVDLKKKLSGAYKNRELNERKLAEWIIRDWGGIKTITKKLDSYLLTIRSNKMPQSISSVASYSKLYAMFYPDRYAIYDARVVVSLNVIQLLAKKPHAIFFPYLPGRNKTTGDAVKKRGFSRVPDFSRNSLLNKKDQSWSTIPNNQLYLCYNELLHVVSEKLDCELVDLEMILFAQAEELVERIAANEEFSYVDWPSYLK